VVDRTSPKAASRPGSSQHLVRACPAQASRNVRCSRSPPSQVSRLSLNTFIALRTPVGHERSPSPKLLHRAVRHGQKSPPRPLVRSPPSLSPSLLPCPWNGDKAPAPTDCYQRPRSRIQLPLHQHPHELRPRPPIAYNRRGTAAGGPCRGSLRDARPEAPPPPCE
jgi:hypothetical protein